MSYAAPPQRVFFDTVSRVFRLYAGNTLYSFCVENNGQLEHLYWGPQISPELDLKYLQSSNVPLTFETTPPVLAAACVICPLVKEIFTYVYVRITQKH